MDLWYKKPRFSLGESSGRHLQGLDMALHKSRVSISLVLLLCAHFFLSSAGKWRAAWWSEFLFAFYFHFPFPYFSFFSYFFFSFFFFLLFFLPSPPLSHHSS